MKHTAILTSEPVCLEYRRTLATHQDRDLCTNIMQIQEIFGGLHLSSLNRLGLRVYELIPDFRDCCPLCSGVGCAVRHGLYRRQVVDIHGKLFTRFPVPRFRCQGRGPGRSAGSTFSVLPFDLVPRRRFSVPLMLKIIELVRSEGSICTALDQLAKLERQEANVLLLDETLIYRVLALFGRAWNTWASARLPSRQTTSRWSGATSLRACAFALAEGLCCGSGSRSDVLAQLQWFHRAHFPQLLFDSS